jgi:hypothetical protein
MLDKIDKAKYQKESRLAYLYWQQNPNSESHKIDFLKKSNPYFCHICRLYIVKYLAYESEDFAKSTCDELYGDIYNILTKVNLNMPYSASMVYLGKFVEHKIINMWTRRNCPRRYHKQVSLDAPVSNNTKARLKDIFVVHDDVTLQKYRFMDAINFITKKLKLEAEQRDMLIKHFYCGVKGLNSYRLDKLLNRIKKQIPKEEFYG